MIKFSRRTYVAGLVMLVLAGIVGYSLWLGEHGRGTDKQFTTERPSDLDDSTRIYFEQRLATTQAAIQAMLTAKQEIDPNMYLSAASDAYALGHLGTAKDLLERQLEANPINYVAWNNYALVLEDMGDYAKADDAFTKTLELERGITKYYEDYASFLLAHFPERRDDLKALYADDLARRGQTAWNMVGLGNWYAAAGECAKAIDHYDVAVTLDPNNQALKDDRARVKTACVETYSH